MLELLLRWYAISTLVTVERDVQVGRKVISFLRLLEEIARNPSELTRTKFRRLHTGSGERNTADSVTDVGSFMDAKMIEDFFDQYGPGEELDVARILADVAELKRAAEPIAALRNTAYAHRSARGPALSSITLGELHAFVDVIADLVQKYHGLLFFSSMLITVPIDQTDFANIFRFAWIEGEARNTSVPYAASTDVVLALFDALPADERAAVRASIQVRP